MFRRLFGLLIAFLAFSAVPAQASKDAFLDRLAGNWVLTGTIMGQATTHDVKGEWVLNQQYLRLIEISREKNASGKPQYEAEVLLAYDPTQKHYVCFWFDNSVIAGTADGGAATRQGDSLPFVFKNAGGDFHNTMAYDAKTDGWIWNMASENKGKLSPFAQLILKRP